MGPLKGVNVIEVGGIGPGPFCAMMLSDMGAHVVRVERKDQARNLVPPRFDVWHRGRKSLGMDLGKPGAVDAVLKLVERADILVEGFRPGVMERLGLGPEVCLERHPGLVYGRMTGWGQEGPLANAAGHDINYIALVGALHSIGRPGENPAPPLNLIGDLGGGGMLLAFGLVCALLESRTSGRGQVVDAAMIDGAAALMGVFYGLRAAGLWNDRRGVNLLDGGAHFYDTYETKDGEYVAIGAIEPQFYALLLEKTGIDDPEFAQQLDFDRWPVLKDKLARVFKTKTRDEWCEIMEGTDVCFAPVLTMAEAMEHPHNKARDVFVDIGGIRQPAPAPRFSRTKPDIPAPTPEVGRHTVEILSEWGVSDEEIERLKQNKAI
jgi:alpha-methylacyl-CoA racemase